MMSEAGNLLYLATMSIQGCIWATPRPSEKVARRTRASVAGSSFILLSRIGITLLGVRLSETVVVDAVNAATTPAAVRQKPFRVIRSMPFNAPEVHWS